ncbi:MAG: hypothetical protein M0C28_28890 [Candidatus Moduliflexus flocculans]|nr:hypothetical protein [Candidatus Moduliflexus flocculans]
MRKRSRSLIFDTLEKLVRDGIDPDMIAASLNTVEISVCARTTLVRSRAAFR